MRQIRERMKLSRIQKYLVIFIIIALAGMLIASALPKVQQVGSASVDRKSIRFSRDSGFYAEEIKVELVAAPGMEIYYTLDGSVPALDNAQAQKYQEEISIEATEEEKAYTLRAAVYQNDMRVSDVESRTYIMGKNVGIRYSIPVLAVTGSPEDFYNYEDGIMVHGKLDEEYIAANPQWAEAFEKHLIPIFGNFYQRGQQAEKEVVATLFDAKGELLFSQNCGFRLYGAFSRMKNQPSFRLYARSEYDVQNDFEYAFFADQYTAEDTIMSDYKRVIVRNGGNDNGYAFIRSEVATKIAKQAGYQDAPSASPVCVYLNGEYYGVHWFVTNFDDGYFRETYGDYPGEMYVFEGQIHALEVAADEEDENYINLAKEYNKQISFFETVDLTQDENWEKLNAFMDVEGFIQYMAIQHYVSNEDSLYNNFRIYRYFTPDGNYTPGTVFDGRYRFLLFDMDYALGLNQERSHVEPEKHMLTTARMDGDELFERFFANVLKRQDCRELYIRHTLSLMNYYYAKDNVATVVDEMHGVRNQELTHMILNTDLLLNNHLAPDITDMDYIAHQLFLMKRFAEVRPEYAKADLQTAFGEMTEYTLQLENPQEAVVTIDYALLHEQQFTGSYFAQVPVEISAKPREGYELVYWLVNGAEIEEKSFVADASLIVDGQISIVCVCEPDKAADLCISGVKSVSGDFVEITNLSMEDKNLGEYCLTDNTSDRKSVLPSGIIKPGQTIIIYCKNYSEIEALGQPMTNFNIKAGETVSLCGTDGRMVDSVAVPQLGSDKGVWRKDMYTGKFREVLLEE
ncbi:MAG: CotH kinase family protein [Lachnospiraceae bacterium]|nr:CotH kinase family protein [Lachnospiraceae bacterium]